MFSLIHVSYYIVCMWADELSVWKRLLTDARIAFQFISFEISYDSKTKNKNQSSAICRKYLSDCFGENDMFDSSDIYAVQTVYSIQFPLKD